MKVLLIIPSFAQHGGIRVCVSWANHLMKWHQVGIHSIAMDRPGNMRLNNDVEIVDKPSFRSWDCLIICSPHGIKYQDEPVKKKIIFMQMMEHYFRPNDKYWQAACFEFYRSKYPMVLISMWNHEEVNKYRRGSTYYIGNGVDFHDFPLAEESFGRDKFKFRPSTVLVEGWEPGNPTKDVDHIGPKVAERLRGEGYRILAYSQLRLKTLPEVPHKYWQKPVLPILNELYEESTIMIKATRMDARSTSPMEAMTKYCVTARAINKGDDDLINEYNCLRCDYDEQQLYLQAKRLLTDHELRFRLACNGIKTIKKWNWDHYAKIINDIIIYS
jgi:hypothetical protein